MVLWTTVFTSLLASRPPTASGFVEHRRPSHSTKTLQSKPLNMNIVSETTSPTAGRDTASMALRQPKSHMNWIIRPANVNDRDGCAALIQRSFGTLLAADYTEECLTNCLPLITSPRGQLLTCNTWYVAEHPETRQIVGCGGWTVRKPQKVLEIVNETPNEASPPLVPHLRHFAVHPDYLRMGIASAIWQRTRWEIQQQFASEDRSFPVLEVYSTITAECFYASLGFVTVDHVVIELVKGSTFPCILMRCEPTLQRA